MGGIIFYKRWLCKLLPTNVGGEIVVGDTISCIIRKIFVYHKTKINVSLIGSYNNHREKYDFIFNYLVSGFFFSFPMMLILSLYDKLTIYRALGLLICLPIILMYSEYYYVWVRDQWKDYQDPFNQKKN